MLSAFSICCCVQIYTILQRSGLGSLSFSHHAHTHQQTLSVEKGKHVSKNSVTLMVVLCGTLSPSLVLSLAKLAHCSECCPANVVMGILGI